MSQNKPFHRCFRGIKEGQNSGYSGWAYVIDQEYAISPAHYTRAFNLIQSDLIKLFEFIEPSDINLNTYSYRTHELLMRSCIECEANFKAILKENIFNPTDRRGRPRTERDWSIDDYKKINKTHHLSSYKVYLPIWEGKNSAFEPFKSWGGNNQLAWYRAYNQSKHDRHNKFKEANFKNLLDAISGLLILLSSQFGDESFSSSQKTISIGGSDLSYYKTKPAIGDLFHIDFPQDWNESELYDFDWNNLRNTKDKFNKINYDI